VRTSLTVVILVFAVALGACGGGGGNDNNPKALGPNPTSSDPGPNPTTYDPGPNNTSNGPVTIEGTLQVTPTCLTLRRPQGPLDLRFRDYKANGTTLVASAGGAPIAHSGDTLAVAGHVADTKNGCGTRFDVDSLVTVLPKH
jgi:hypothetical protein